MLRAGPETSQLEDLLKSSEKMMKLMPLLLRRFFPTPAEAGSGIKGFLVVCQLFDLASMQEWDSFPKWSGGTRDSVLPALQSVPRSWAINTGAAVVTTSRVTPLTSCFFLLLAWLLAE